VPDRRPADEAAGRGLGTHQPPAASTVYELTDRGRELEPILDALGTWGITEPLPAPATLTATSVLLYLRGCARAHPKPPPHTYRLQLDERAWTVHTRGGLIEVDPCDGAERRP
jgi:hypothetical protein